MPDGEPALPEWKTCDAKWGDLRHKMGNQHNQRGRPATPDGEPALPEWQTCDKKCFPFARRSRSLPAPAVLALPVPSLPLPVPSLPLPASRTPGSTSETLRNTLIY